MAQQNQLHGRDAAEIGMKKGADALAEQLTRPWSIDHTDCRPRSGAAVFYLIPTQWYPAASR